MKRYNQPATEILLVMNYLCQNVASPAGGDGYHPLDFQGQGSGQSGAM